MDGITMRNARQPFLLAAMAATLLVAGGGSGGPTAPVGAAFPGKNGLIAFSSNLVTPTNPEGDSEIFAMNPDGTGLTQLTFNTVVDNEPTWSPNGKMIAFMTNRDGNLEVYTMTATGGNQTNRTNNGNGVLDELSDWQPKPRGRRG